MDRRTMLKLGIAAAAGAGLHGVRPLAAAAAGGTFRDLGDGVGVFTERGGTIAWLVSGDGVAVVDTQFPDTAAHLLDGLAERAIDSIDVVFNTHHHFDHTMGNAAFRDRTEAIVAHANVPKLQRASAEARGELDAQVYAKTTFEREWKGTIGGETVTARHFGPAHTGGDAVIHFENAGVVHVGDLVFNRMVPFCDPEGGCSIRGWVEVLGRVRESYPKDARFVFGHAGGGHDVVGTAADLPVMAGYLEGLLDYVAEGKRAGKTVDVLASVDRIPGFPDHEPGWETAIRNNVELAFAQLD